MFHFFFISRYHSPRAKKPFELKYMQHIVIIYWLCITCIPYVNYEIAKDKPPHDFSVSFYQQLWNWKYRVSKGIILSFCLLAQMHNSIASSPSHILYQVTYYKIPIAALWLLKITRDITYNGIEFIHLSVFGP